jgi:hypothetical protein
VNDLVKRAKLNYWVDVSIGIAFVLSAISGLVFLLPADFGSSTGLLGISHRVWDSMHTWSSLTMIAGVLLHLLLHWKWIANMTGKVMLHEPSPRKGLMPTSRTAMTRRQFLSLGLAAVVAGVIASCVGVAGARVIGDATDNAQTSSRNDAMPAESGSRGDGDDVAVEGLDQGGGGAAPTDELEQGDGGSEAPVSEPEQPLQGQGGVACPRGVVNDPYPGQCRHYVDADGNGFCDYSAPGSGNN